MIKQFKQHMIDKDFFGRLKLIMYEIDKELQMARNGGSISDDFVDIHKDKGRTCQEPIRKMVTHSEDFKEYIKGNT